MSKCAQLHLHAQSMEMFVDSEGNDVFHWGVELSGFADGSGLGQVGLVAMAMHVLQA